MVRAQKKLRTLGEQALALRFLSATSDARPVLEDAVLLNSHAATRQEEQKVLQCAMLVVHPLRHNVLPSPYIPSCHIAHTPVLDSNYMRHGMRPA